ncbi:MAG: biotin transporter BioY, partial [Homoserinimonas sp.]|nr:biotin transporter BioY [Homoserinimonas sp.]
MTALMALVAVGLPLLAGGHGGIGIFIGPSAGFALGWIVGALVVGLIVHAGGRKPVLWRTFLGAVTGGILAIYAVGIPVQSALTHLPLAETALTSLIFVPGDLVKAVLATGIVMTLVRAYPRAFRRVWAAKPTAVTKPERTVVP